MLDAVISVIKSTGNPNHDAKGRFASSASRWTAKEKFWSMNGGKGRFSAPRDESKMGETVAKYGKEFDSPVPHERYMLTSNDAGFHEAGYVLPASIAYKQAEISGNDEVGWLVDLYGEKVPNEYFKAGKIRGKQMRFPTRQEAQDYGEHWLKGK